MTAFESKRTWNCSHYSQEVGMRFKGNQPVPETVHPDEEQPLVRYPVPENEGVNSVEEAIDRENKETDESNVKEIEQTSEDYWGRRSQETDGVVPAEPPNVAPVAQKRRSKPKRPP